MQQLLRHTPRLTHNFPQSQQDRLAHLPPAEQSRQKTIGAAFVKYIFWTTPILGLLFAAIATLVLTGTLSFVLGGHALNAGSDLTQLDLLRAAIRTNSHSPPSGRF